MSLYEDIFALRSLLETAKVQGIQGRVTKGRFWDELLLLEGLCTIQYLEWASRPKLMDAGLLKMSKMI
ncbi:hypothetical protein KC19_VG243900 [Ceratodon purpureus]|uniref:Uncharacterized protein n=1 Tax=Ceratodon purpureus TaxID=3225 RepID=A0A8T0HTT6_CERPU|nr:hypothetical protein KC19_VG243900 [Ceratodon purpureus]